MKPLSVFKWYEKLVEVVGTADRPVVFFKIIKEEDKPKCQCGRTIDEEIVMVVDSPLFRENAKPVETIEKGGE